MARTAAYTRSKNGIGAPDPSMRSRAARTAAGQAPGLGDGDGDGEGVAAGAARSVAGGGATRSGRAWGVVLISEGSTPGRAGTLGAAAGAGAASGAPGAGPSPGPLRAEVGTLGTVSETSLTYVRLVFHQALLMPTNMYAFTL